jgi:phosphoglycerate dehydrogenase-like enzyme
MGALPARCDRRRRAVEESPPVIRAATTIELDADARAALDAALAPDATLHLLDPQAPAADPEAEILISHTPPAARDGFPRVRWIQLITSGVDHVELDASWDGVTITTASGLFTVPIAEYVIGSLFFVAQHVPARLARAEARDWTDRWELSGTPLAGSTIVLLGYGSIGREIARLASALRMRIIAVKARPDLLEATGFAEPGTGDPDGSLPDEIVGIGNLAEVVGKADWLVSSLPLTDRTRALVDEKVIAAMRPGAWLINVGRGAVVDEDALVRALHAGAIGGAVLDVFSQEPLPPDHPLWSAPNAVLTAHISGGLERFEVLGEIVRQNLARLRRGEPLLNAVDRVRGY